MAKKILSYVVIWDATLDPKTGEFNSSDHSIEATVDSLDAAKIGDRTRYTYRQPFPFDENMTLGDLKAVIEQKVLGDIS